MSRAVVILLAAMCALAAPQRAFADRIVITGGDISLSSPQSGLDPPFGFELVGDGTLIRAETFVVGFAGFRVGQVADLSTSVFLRFPIHRSQGTIGRVEFDAFLTGGLRFVATPFIATAASSFETPFTMAGSIAGFDDRSLTGAPLFTASLTGRGTASVIGMRNFGGDLLALGPTAFHFAATPGASVPEPATLMMLVAGLAVVTRRLRGARSV
jgi:hypothetical protein